MERLIEHCTQNIKTQDNIQEYFEISDLASQNPKEAVRLLTPRIFSGKNITSQKAANILKTCCLNSGLSFNKELSCKDFVNNFKKHFSRLDLNVQKTLFEIINEVEKEYKNDPSIDLLVNLNTHISKNHPELYYTLRMNTETPNTKTNTVTTKMSKLPERKTIQSEDYDLKKALELSLRETSPMPPRQEYPSLRKEIDSMEEKVKALYDFEAVEDNELNFKTGDLITLIDSTDNNWWKGKLNGKIGLFPVQFVSRETKTRTTSNGVSSDVKEIKQEPVVNVALPVVNKIDEDKLDKCLAMMNKLDENKTIKDDPQELLSLEKECESMGPLVDEEIRTTEFQLDKISEMEENIVKVLSSYQEALEKQQAMVNNQPQTPQIPSVPPQFIHQFYNGMQYPNQNVYTPPMGYPPSYIASHPNQNPQPNINQYAPVQYPFAYQPMDPNQIAAYQQFLMQQQQQQQLNSQNTSQNPNINEPSSNPNT